MPKSVLFLQGAGEDGYDADLKLVDSLRGLLGEDYTVVYPRMPDADHPRHEQWKAAILQQLAALGSETIVVGHSLGASLLLKVLSEETTSAAAVFLIATPYWRAEDWEVDEYALRDDFATHLPQVPISLYHSRDDEIVPFEHVNRYAQMLPQAHVREFDGRGHQFNDDLSEVAADIQQL